MRGYQVGLGLLSAFAAFYPMGQSYVEDMFGAIKNSVSSGFLPDSPAKFHSWTGIRLVDSLLAGVSAVFFSVANGYHPAASLQGFRLLGLFIAEYMLIMLEAERKGNQEKLLSNTSLWGQLMIFFSAAVALPPWCQVQLATSPTAFSPTAQSITPKSGFQLSIPFGITTGFILPLVTAAILSPAVASGRVEKAFGAQLAVLLIPVFPILVSVAQRVAGRFSGAKTQNRRDTESRSSLRSFYSLAITISAVPHLIAMTLSILSLTNSSLLRPDLVRAFNPKVWLFPTFSLTPVSSVAEGAMRFLQWDECISSAAIVTWAVLLRCGINGEEGLRGKRGVNPMKVGLKAAALSVLLGPAGAAAWLVWERDMKVLDRNDQGERKEK